MIFFSTAWAEAVRRAVDVGPDEATRAGKLDTYWDWIDQARDGYGESWALGRCKPGGGTDYLLLRWKDGRCVAARIADSPAPDEAAYVLTAGVETWRDLLAGEDTGRIVMYRRLRLERGEILSFFQIIYFFVESVAAIGRVPATLDA